MLKRSAGVIAVALLLGAGFLFYRSYVTPVRPAGVPSDAVACRFGLALQWVSIGPPRTREIVDGAVMNVYDRSGHVRDRAVVTLARPPKTLDTSQAQGYVAFPRDVLRDFEFPSGETCSGHGSGNAIVIEVDASRALVPWWWFK